MYIRVPNNTQTYLQERSLFQGEVQRL